MKNTTLIIIFVLLFTACKKDKKKVIVNETTDVVEAKMYPELEGMASNIIFDNGYKFADDIVIDYIALENKGKDKYQLIYRLGNKSNLDKIEKLKTSAVFYAINPNEFKDKIYRDRKSRQVAAKCKIYSLDNEKIIAFDFEMIPKEFKLIKFYFYNDVDGVINDKIMSVRGINLPE